MNRLSKERSKTLEAHGKRELFAPPKAEGEDFASKRGDKHSAQSTTLKGGAEREAGGTSSNAQAEPAPLGNTRIGFPANESAVKRRRERWKMRDELAHITSIERVAKCGTVPVAQLISLKSNPDGQKAGFGGLAVCGSVWACPVCSAKIASHRKSDLEHVLEHATAQGFQVSMLTLTQRHHRGQRLSLLWDALSTAWNRVTSGRQWQEFRSQLGIIGYVRANEVTHGRNGWHVHSHVLFISKKDPITTPYIWQAKQGRRKLPPPPVIKTPAEFVADRWEAGLAKHGVDFLRNSGGLDWEIAESAKAVGLYVSKMQTNSISSEVTLGGFKHAKNGNRTPFQILADIIKDGDVDDVDIWHEYEKSSHGRRALTWSKGLREWAELGAELTDEEIAELEEGSETFAVLDQENWHRLREIGALELLLVCESSGQVAALRWLDHHGIEWSPPPR